MSGHKIQDWPLDALLAGTGSMTRLEGRVRCSELALQSVSIRPVGRPDTDRQVDLLISDPRFQGRLECLIGPGSATVRIHTRGLLRAQLTMHRQCALTVGARTTINGARMVLFDSDVEVGEDNLWPDEILVQSSDQHGIHA